MNKQILAACAAAVILLPLQGTAQAASNGPEVRQCVSHIAKQERDSARKTQGKTRRELIAALGQAKIACMSGKIDEAYATAAKLRLDPQQASARQ